MMTQELNQNIDQDLAEKCRIALEKSYGCKIPMPKTTKKHRKLP